MQRLDKAVQGGGGRLTEELLLLLRQHLAQEQVTTGPRRMGHQFGGCRQGACRCWVARDLWAGWDALQHAAAACGADGPLCRAAVQAPCIEN